MKGTHRYAGLCNALYVRAEDVPLLTLTVVEGSDYRDAPLVYDHKSLIMFPDLNMSG